MFVLQLTTPGRHIAPAAKRQRRYVPAGSSRLVNGLRLLLCAGLGASLSACGAPRKSPTGAGEVSVEDVHRFVSEWQSWSPADSACDALRPYWDERGPGLAIYRRQFHVDFDDLCTAVRKRPEQYSQLTSRLAELDSVAAAVKEVYSRFNAVRPLEGEPSVYLVVGTGVSAGSTIRGRDPAILIGMERNRSSKGLPWTIAHELVHSAATGRNQRVGGEGVEAGLGGLAESPHRVLRTAVAPHRSAPLTLPHPVATEGVAGPRVVMKHEVTTPMVLDAACKEPEGSELEAQ